MTTTWDQRMYTFEAKSPLMFTFISDIQIPFPFKMGETMQNVDQMRASHIGDLTDRIKFNITVIIEYNHRLKFHRLKSTRA